MMTMGRTRSVAGRRRALALTVALTSVAVMGLTSSTSVAADTGDQKRQADQQVASAQDALEGTSAALVTAYNAYLATTAKLPAAQALLDAASSAQRVASQGNDAVAGQLAVAQADEARAVEQATANAVALQSTQDALDGYAADLFQGSGESQLSVALGATSADDFATRLVLADTVTSLTASAISHLRSARAEDLAQKAYLTAVRGEVDRLNVAAEQAMAQATAARQVAQDAKTSLDSLVRQRAGQYASLEAQKGAEQARLDAAQVEQGRLQAQLVAQARRAAAAAAASRAKGTYVAVSGGTGFLSSPGPYPITSPFGMRYHPIRHLWELHTGTDFGMPCGTPVHAAADGTVISAGWGGGDGNRLVIDHGIVSGVDLVSTYNHLTSFVVTGGHVSRGQVIAYSGTTGWSTGCHLHFETLENGSFVNPMKWL